MHLEVLIDKTFVESAVLVDYLNFVCCVLSIPNANNTTALE